MIRTLKANEIECRVGQVFAKQKAVACLLYKDARVDMTILDEVFGSGGWQRTHEVIGGQLFCNIDIWDSEKKCWVRKQDVGTESMTEKEKGRASDSFKRAGFNVGIGRELYTAPFIWINLNDYEFNNGKPRVQFEVKEVDYDSNRRINRLVIVDKDGKERFKLGSPVTVEKKDSAQDAIMEIHKCKTRDEANKVWNKYKQFQKDKTFLAALKAVVDKIDKK